MKLYPILFAGSLVLGACGVETPEADPENVPPVNVAGVQLQEDLPPDNAATNSLDEFLKRLNESEGESSEKWDPLQKPDPAFVVQDDNASGTDNSPLVPGGKWRRLEEVWNTWSHEERRNELERMAGEGNTWAKETIRKLDKGEILPAELNDAGDRYVTETIYPRRSYTVRLRSDNGCAPMPFGESMHGPWDTGGGYEP